MDLLDGVKTAAARVAMTRHRDTVRAATVAYYKAVLHAKQRCVKELDEARRQAVTLGRMEESMGIAQAIDRLTSQIEEINVKLEVRSEPADSKVSDLSKAS